MKWLTTVNLAGLIIGILIGSALAPIVIEILNNPRCFFGFHKSTHPFTETGGFCERCQMVWPLLKSRQ